MRIVLAIALLAMAGCRGEPVPRDYQNNPPGMTNPADSAREAPSPESSTSPPPEPSTGAEGTSGPYERIPSSPQPTQTTT